MTARTAAWSFVCSGDIVEWDWCAGGPNVFELDSVRVPRAHSRARHIPAQAFSTTTRRSLLLESGLEYELFRLLDADPTVLWMVAQPCRIEFRSSASRLAHVPDLLSLDGQGRVTVWDAQPAARADAPFWRVASLTAAACEAVGWGHRVFHGEPSSPTKRTTPEIDRGVTTTGSLHLDNHPQSPKTPRRPAEALADD